MGKSTKKGGTRKKSTKTVEMSPAQVAAEKVGALLQMGAEDLRTALQTDPVQALQAELATQPELLEAWSSRVSRVLADESYSLVEPLLSLGDGLLALFEASDVCETNVMPSFAKWLTQFNSKKFAKNLKDDVALTAVYSVLRVLAEQLETPEFATAFDKIHANLLALVRFGVEGSGIMSVRVGRVAMEALLAGALCGENKFSLDHMKIVELLPQMTDLPMLETLVVVIRKCIVNVSDSKRIDRDARTKFRSYIPTEDLYNQFLHSGKTESGAVNWAIAYNSLAPKFHVLHCTACTFEGTQYNDTTIYLHTTSMTFNPAGTDVGAWIDLSYDDFKDIKSSGSKIVITVSGCEVAIMCKNSPARRVWYKKLAEHTGGMVDDDEPEDEPEAPRRGKSTATNVKAKSKSLAPPSSPPLPPASISRARSQAAKNLLLGRSEPRVKSSPITATKRTFPQLSLFSDMETSSAEEPPKKRRKREELTLLPQSLRIGSTPTKDMERTAPNMREPSTKWEAPESLLMGSNWMNDEESSDDEEEIEKMKQHFAESIAKDQKTDPTDELKEMMNDVQHVVNETKRTRIDTPREEFFQSLQSMKENLGSADRQLKDMQGGEKALTKSVQTAHTAFLHKRKLVRQELQQLDQDNSEVMSNNDHLMQQMNETIQTLVTKGFDVLKKKVWFYVLNNGKKMEWFIKIRIKNKTKIQVKKKKNKADAVVNMFSMIAHEFAQKK